MAKKIERALWGLMVVGLLVVLFWPAKFRSKHHKWLVVNQSTLAEAVEHIPFQCATAFEKDGTQVLLLRFEKDYHPWELPSGSPIGAYSQSGHLLDFTLDSGDNPSFMDRWRSDKVTEFRLPEEILNWVE